MKYLKTSDIAKAVGVHPNTVRMYEEFGFLPPVPRGHNGYRLFTEDHIDLMRLSWTAIRSTWLGGYIRRAAFSIIESAVSGDFKGALEQAKCHLELVQAERLQAEAAAELLENWAQESAKDGSGNFFSISEAAVHLDVTADMLRNWESNGLVAVPRNPGNGYRIYGEAEIRRLKVIRTLRRARYSTMSILRMFNRFDKGQKENLRLALDTLNPEEDDILYTTDRWLSTLAQLECHARDMIPLLEAIIRKQNF